MAYATAQATASTMVDLTWLSSRQHTRLVVITTRVAFRANLLPGVQALLEAMRIPRDEPLTPPESG